MTLFAFGDLFRYKNNEYIYLAETEDVLFAARILSFDQSKTLTKYYEAAIKKNSGAVDGPVYSFVMLETKDLLKRAAYFRDTGNERFESYLFTPINIKLSKKDLLEIKNEITKKKCISIKLQELVRDIQI